MTPIAHIPVFNQLQSIYLLDLDECDAATVLLASV